MINAVVSVQVVQLYVVVVQEMGACFGGKQGAGRRKNFLSQRRDDYDGEDEYRAVKTHNNRGLDECAERPKR
jgi:hypothetical protein